MNSAAHRRSPPKPQPWNTYANDPLAGLLVQRLESDLRTSLQQTLPEYMVPAAYVVLDKLPLTANGKLDRKALPAPEGDAYSRGRYEAPVGTVETAIAAISCEILSIDRVGRHDNFFELGGHSLLAIRVLERMRRAGLQADVKALFEAPTLSKISTRIVRISDLRVAENRQLRTVLARKIAQLSDIEVAALLERAARDNSDNNE